MTKKSLFTLFTVFYALCLVIYFFLPYNGTKLLLQYICILSSLTVATMSGIYAVTEYGLAATKSRTLLFFTSGIGCWLIGEILWTYYEYIALKNPFPSVADIFYLSAYPLFFFGFIKEIQSSKINWHKLKKSVLFLMVMAACLLGIVVGYIGIFLAYSPVESPLTNLIAISYGMGDLVLIICAMALLILAWEFKGGELSHTWLYMFFSFLLTLIADILFAIFTVSYNQIGSYTRGFIDSLWILAYLLFAYAFFSFVLSIRSAHAYMQKLKGIKRPVD